MWKKSETHYDKLIQKFVKERTTYQTLFYFFLK